MLCIFCVRQGSGGFFIQCCEWECWAGWGPSFCTTSRQSPLPPLLTAWWTYDSTREPKRSHCLNAIMTGGALWQQSNYNIKRRKSAGTHHQELQVRSLGWVFDQTAGATESLVHCHIASNKQNAYVRRAWKRNKNVKGASIRSHFLFDERTLLTILSQSPGSHWCKPQVVV